MGEDGARKENPDVVVAIIHSGRDHTHTTGNWVENASQLVAERVPGIDIVLFGHDHQFFCDSVKTPTATRCGC